MQIAMDQTKPVTSWWSSWGFRAAIATATGLLIVPLVLLLTQQTLIRNNEQAYFHNQLRYQKSMLLYGGKPPCVIQSIEYTSSPLEIEWLENIEEWQKAEPFCDAMKGKDEEWKTLQAAVDQYNYNAADPEQPVEEPPPSHPMLSRFKYTMRCGKDEVTGYDFIEPLYGALRQFEAPCNTGTVIDRRYLLLANPYTRRSELHPESKKFLFDLGASTFKTGPGGSSQDYFVQKFKQRGIVFDRMLLWEANMGISDKQIFDEVPGEVYPAYQYFHTPATADPKDPRNPLNILKKIATPYDFVVLKLDIDTPTVENAFVDQILADPELQSLIDEFVYEHHVKFPFMQRLGWGDGVADVTLAESYQLFLKLRKQGIRAHGWP